MMDARTTKVRAKVAPRMDHTRYTHAYVVNVVPEYAGYCTTENGRTVTHLGKVFWNQQDREWRNVECRQIVRLCESDGVYTISAVGPLSVRDWSAQRLAKARAWNGEWRILWTGDALLGVTQDEAVKRLRAVRDALQEDADAYRRGN